MAHRDDYDVTDYIFKVLLLGKTRFPKHFVHPTITSLFNFLESPKGGPFIDIFQATRVLVRAQW
jgi:hypothetical protein